MKMAESRKQNINCLFSRSFFWRSLLPVAAVGFLALGAGCSLEQDPYADQPDSIKKSVPPEQSKGEPSRATASDALRIDTADFYSMKEGKPTEIAISARVLLSVNGNTPVLGKDFDVEVENLKDFPGAQYDPVTGKFTWTPPFGFVDKESTRNAALKLVLTTHFEPRMTRRKEVLIFVTRAENDPEIVEVTDLNSWNTYEEGQEIPFTVRVKDPDALPMAGMRPRILLIEAGTNRSGSPYVQLDPGWRGDNPFQDPMDPSVWIFRMVFDTTKKEVTQSQENFSFGVVVTSRFGRVSAPKTVTLQLKTSIRPPKTTWLTVADFYAGQQNKFSFSAFDALEEGDVTVTTKNLKDLPGGNAAFRCRSMNNSSSQSCTLDWLVPDTVKDGSTYYLEADVINTSKGWWSTTSQKILLKGQIKVINKLPPKPPASAGEPSVNGGGV